MSKYCPATTSCAFPRNYSISASLPSSFSRFYTSKCYVDNNEKSFDIVEAQKHLFSGLGLIYGVSIFFCVVFQVIKVINASMGLCVRDDDVCIAT